MPLPLKLEKVSSKQTFEDTWPLWELWFCYFPILIPFAHLLKVGRLCQMIALKINLGHSHGILITNFDTIA